MNIDLSMLTLQHNRMSHQYIHDPTFIDRFFEQKRLTNKSILINIQVDNVENFVLSRIIIIRRTLSRVRR